MLRTLCGELVFSVTPPAEGRTTHHHTVTDRIDAHKKTWTEPACLLRGDDLSGKECRVGRVMVP